MPDAFLTAHDNDDDEQYNASLVDTPPIAKALQPSDELPRHDLREPAFRKYEPLLALAIKQTVIIHADRFPGMRASSIVCRLRDAIVAKKRYSYTSDSIPHDYNWSNIRIRELTNQRVILSNLLYDRKLSSPDVLNANNPDGVIALLRSMLAYTVADKQFIRFDTDADKQSLFAIERSPEFMHKVMMWDPQPGVMTVVVAKKE